MKKVPLSILDFMNKSIVNNIVTKYGIDEKEAISVYLNSETYKMLIDYETEVYTMSDIIVFEMWEAERITGNPRNSSYIRS